MSPNSQPLPTIRGQICPPGYKLVKRKVYEHAPLREIIRTSTDPQEIRELLEAIEQTPRVSRSTLVKCRKAAEYRLRELPVMSESPR